MCDKRVWVPIVSLVIDLEQPVAGDDEDLSDDDDDGNGQGHAAESGFTRSATLIPRVSFKYQPEKSSVIKEGVLLKYGGRLKGWPKRCIALSG